MPVETTDVATTRELLAEIAARDTDADAQLEARPVERVRLERRFVTWLLAAILILVVIIFAVLWWLDPVSATGRQTRFSVVENGGVRQAKLDLMERLAAPPHVLVLGSSRSMKIDPKTIHDFTGQTAFNGGVSGGTSKDIYLYARYADQLWGVDQHRFPHLVIGVVNDVFRDAGTAGFDPRLRRFLPSADRQRKPLQVVQALLEWKTLQSAARVTPKVVHRDGYGALVHPVQKSGALNADLAVTGKQQSNQAKNFSSRGFQLFNPVRSLKTPLARRMDVQMREYVKNTYTNDPTYTGIDQTALVLMRRTIALANQNGDVPTIWVTPYHPRAAAKYLPHPEYERRNKVFLDAMHRLQADPNLHFTFVEETSDIASYGGVASEFYDGIHQMPSNLTRVMRYLHDRGLLARQKPASTPLVAKR
ncbi:MAG: hypothetical protein JWN41_598 [Thermoleophilia bacterium]|nr:hypothetical protein [Thermoleophilia bacterium]